MKRYIEGTINLVTPLHCTMPSKARLRDDGLITYGNDGKPLNVTMVAPVSTQDGVFDVPFYPGNSLKAGIRRAAGNLLIDQLGPVDLPVFHGLMCGASSGQPAKGVVDDVLLMARMRQNLYLGAFGGGPYLSRSGFNVRNLVPIIPQTVGETGAGMVPTRYSSLAQRYLREDGENRFHPRRILPVFHHFRRDDLVTNKIDLSGIINDYHEAAARWIEKIVGNKAARDKVKAQKTAQRNGSADASDEPVEEVKSNGLASMFAVQAIAAGVQMYFRLDFKDHLTPAQIYLVAEGLRQSLQEPLGGMQRIGYGVVMPDLYYVGDQGRSQLYDITEDDLGQEMRIANEVAEFKEAFDQALATLTHAELKEFLYFDAEESAAAKAEKAVKKAAKKSKAAEPETTA